MRVLWVAGFFESSEIPLMARNPSPPDDRQLLQSGNIGRHRHCMLLLRHSCPARPGNCQHNESDLKAWDLVIGPFILAMALTWVGIVMAECVVRNCGCVRCPRARLLIRCVSRFWWGNKTVASQPTSHSDRRGKTVCPVFNRLLLGGLRPPIHHGSKRWFVVHEP